MILSINKILIYDIIFTKILNYNQNHFLFCKYKSNYNINISLMNN